MQGTVVTRETRDRSRKSFVTCVPRGSERKALRRTVARMGADVQTKSGQDNREERVGLEDLGVDGRKILN
jgi:hypothetical protein